MQTVAHRAAPTMSARRSAALHGNQVGRRPSLVRPVRRTVVVQAGLRDVADWLAAGFMKIFTPPSDSGVNWTGTSTGYPGDINRSHATKYPPVQQAKKDSVGSDQALAMDMKEDQVAGTENTPEVAEYIAGALQRVMGHNFVGDETEPDWNGTSTGWSGDIRKRRDRDGDGFHSKKL